MFNKNIELRYLNLINSNKTSVFSRSLLFFLKLLSKGFASIVERKNHLYDTNRKQGLRVPEVFVISVGNITSGGTAKTPFCIKLAKNLSLEKKVCIVSRGYRAKKRRGSAPIKVEVEHDPDIVGDEPLMMANHFREGAVFVSKNKKKALLHAKEQGFEIIILDDGMQKRALHRDLEIVMIDGKNPFSNGYLLPRGLLREPKESLKRADIIVLSSLLQPDERGKIEREIRRYSNAPILRAHYAPKGFFDEGDAPTNLEEKRKLALFTGIANPSSFISSIKSLGHEIVATKILADHKAPSMEELIAFAKKGEKEGASCLVCTEKDRVKIKKIPSLSLPLYTFKASLETPGFDEIYQSIVLKAQSILEKL